MLLNMMHRKIITLLVFTAAVTGCTKAPSSVSDLSQYGTNSFPTQLSDLESVLGSTYANIRSQQLYGFQTLCKTFAACEHTSNLNYGGMDFWSDIEYNNLKTSNSLAQDSWTGYYVGVKDANTTLEAADFYEKNYMVPGELAQVNNIRGEAYFLRAWYYFQLECFFGESYISSNGGGDKKGVPLFIHVPKTLADTRVPRATVRQVWDQIISDCTLASQLLKGVVRSGNDLGRVTDWCAKGLLGKAYVFTQSWDSAKIVLKDVIDNSGKTLMPWWKYQMAFNSNVGNSLNNNTNEEFNEESLFEINVDRVPAAYGIFGDPPNKNLTTTMGVIWSPSGYNDDGTIPTGMGYANENVHDRNLVRFGFHLPLPTLVNNPAYNPAITSPFNLKSVPDTAFTRQSKEYRTNKTDDPRLYVCALQPFFDTVFFKLAGAGMLRPVSKCVNIPTPDYQGWSYKKYQTLDANLGDINYADGANYYLLRMADIYLLYAEACMNAGDNVSALEYINKVHRRAYDQPVNSPSVYDYASLSAPTVTSQDDVNLSNNPLRYERYAELFAEGHWWFDVCRWRIGAAEAAFYGNLLPNNYPSQWDDNRSYSFPIPLQEITSNPAMINQQNPGY
jgi:starch-binding outer membrane protein, SusD/RagB family